jgi:hypothetical protein
MPRRALWSEATRLRANPDYELLPLDRLPPSLQGLDAELAGAPDVYGIARPRGATAAGLKAVDCDTALLLLTLREPAPLPRFARLRLGHRAAAVVDALVLDGVLEVERDGTFVSGPGALDAAPDRDRGPAPDALVPRLSHAALAYAAALDVDDVAALARRLYGYHRVPLTPAWRATLLDAAATARWLGADDGPTAAALRRRWRANAPAAGEPAAGEPAPYWLSWAPRRQVGDAPPPAAAYKLYVSPACDATPAAFRATVAVLARCGSPPFKVGASAHGILRPDKLVVYLSRLEEIYEVAAALAAELRGTPAHGVPFTGPIGDDGLLSWGVDPGGAESLGTGERQSWRSRLAARLAASLAGARALGESPAAACRYAVARVRHAGVDPDTWAPITREWEAEDAG